MDQAWSVPARASFDIVGLASTSSDNDHMVNENCIDQPYHFLYRPRAPPPPPPSNFTAQNRQKQTCRKSTRKRKNTYCSPSDLHEQHLHRNRVAASKYRQKHKIWSDTLAERCRNETQKWRFLKDMTRFLKEEVLFLKDQAIQQSGCNCMMMKLYLERQTQTVNLFGVPNRSSISPLVTTSQDSISPSSSAYTSFFDENLFNDFVW